MRLFFRSKTASDSDDNPRLQRGPGLTGFTSYSGLRRNPGQQRDRNPERRTPPGGQNRTFSYYASRSQRELNTGRETIADKPLPRRLPSRLRRLRSHAGWLAGGIVALGLVAYNLQLSSDVKIVSLVPEAEAPFLQDAAHYRQAASQAIHNSVTNRNKLTINTTAIANDMRRQFPELQAVTVTIPLLGDRPTVHIRPAEPSMVLASGSDTFLIDRQGRALSEARSQSQLDRLGIPTVSDQSNLDFALGERVLSRHTAAFIGDVGRQLRSHDVAVQAMVLLAGGSELNVYPAGKPYFIKYNLHDETEQAAALQTGSYLAVEKYLRARQVTPAQYVDVRLQGRAYYK